MSNKQVPIATTVHNVLWEVCVTYQHSSVHCPVVFQNMCNWNTADKSTYAAKTNEGKYRWRLVIRTTQEAARVSAKAEAVSSRGGGVQRFQESKIESVKPMQSWIL